MSTNEKELVELNLSVCKKGYFFFLCRKKLGTPWPYCVPDKSEKLQANFSLKHCHVFSHTTPPICAKNLSNYLSSGKPYLIIFLCFALTDCSHCFLLTKQPADLSAVSFFQITSAQFVQFIRRCTVACGLWALWGWTCFLQHLARELCPCRVAAPNCNINSIG